MAVESVELPPRRAAISVGVSASGWEMEPEGSVGMAAWCSINNYVNAGQSSVSSLVLGSSV